MTDTMIFEASCGREDNGKNAEGIASPEYEMPLYKTIAPEDRQLGATNRETSQCTTVSHVLAPPSSLQIRLRNSTQRVLPSDANSNAGQGTSPGTAIMAAARTSCSRTSDAFICKMMDGLPNTGEEPKRKLLMEAVGNIETGVEICGEGGDQSDMRPNHDTLAT